MLIQPGKPNRLTIPDVKKRVGGVHSCEELEFELALRGVNETTDAIVCPSLDPLEIWACLSCAARCCCGTWGTSARRPYRKRRETRVRSAGI